MQGHICRVGLSMAEQAASNLRTPRMAVGNQIVELPLPLLASLAMLVKPQIPGQLHQHLAQLAVVRHRLASQGGRATSPGAADAELKNEPA